MTADRGDEKRRHQAENCHQQVVTAGSTDDVDPITSGHLVVTPGDVGDVDPVTTPRSGERMAGKRGDGGMVSAAMITGRSGTTCHHPGRGDRKRRRPFGSRHHLGRPVTGSKGTVETQSAGQHRAPITIGDGQTICGRQW